MPLLKVLAAVGACLSPVMNLWKRNDGSLLWRPLSSADAVIHRERIRSSLKRIVTDLGLDQQNSLSYSNYSFLAAQSYRHLEAGREGKSNFIASPRCLKCVFYFLPPREVRCVILILQERKCLRGVNNLPKVMSWKTELSGLAQKPFSVRRSADNTVKEGYLCCALRSQKMHSMLEDLETGRMLRRITFTTTPNKISFIVWLA